MPSPIPPLPPVTMATLPVRSKRLFMVQIYRFALVSRGGRETMNVMDAHRAVHTPRSPFRYLAPEHLVFAVAAREQVGDQVQDFVLLQRIEQTFRHHRHLGFL